MAKSNYPSKLDTSKELPAVRDNILEIGSETINGIRSAIFNIERTLGINPHGSVGNTVSNRLNAISDGSGNLRKDALTKANILSGPVMDVDIGAAAAISESKLRLKFPTQVLQDEISAHNAELELIQTELEALTASLSAHLHASAVNRHKAEAISVEQETVIPSDTSLLELDSTNVQAAIQSIHSRHIQYTGESISDVNNSHNSSQIYFDDASIEELLSADDVQEAIEKTALLTTVQTIQHQDRMHSNGYLNNGFLKDPTNGEIGLILAKDQAVSFGASSGESDGLSKITFDTAITLNGFSLNAGDLVVIEDVTDLNNLYTGTYEIAKINLSGDSLSLLSVEVHGVLNDNNKATTLVTVAKNPRRRQSVPGLALSVREKATLTSADSIQIANPNAVAIISSGVKPSEITSTNRFIVLSEDEGSDIILDLYDSASSNQSIDTILKRINEQVAEGDYNFLAYRIDSAKYVNAEFAIVHNIPDSSSDQHTLRVSNGSDNAIVAAGLSYAADSIFSAEVGSLYFINGESLSGLREKLNETGISFFAGDQSIQVGTSSIDFLTAGVKIGDLLIITNAEDNSDNGSYVISNVLSQSITISSDQLPSGFSGDSDDDTAFIIYDSIFNIESIDFEKVATSFGAAIVECAITDSKEAIWNKRLEYSAVLSGIEPVFLIVDYTDDLENDDELSLVIELDGGVVYASLDGGLRRRIAGDNNYIWIYSGNSNKNLKLFVASEATLNSYLTVNGTITKTIFGFDSLNYQSNLRLGKVPFGSFKGRALGGLGTDAFRVFDTVDKGSVGSNDLNTTAIETLSEIPIRELRSSGIIRGLEVSGSTITSGLYEISVDFGVCYIRGKRFEVSSQTIETNIDSTVVDKFYIAINSEGEIEFAKANAGTCDNPFAESDTLTIGSVEYDNVTIRIIDLRLFVSDIDLKLLNSITVSPDPRMGHFSSLPKAIKYAKRFSDLYPSAGIPTVHLKSGTHIVTVQKDETSRDFATWFSDLAASPSSVLDPFYTEIFNSGVFVDFPINIEGEGESTILKIRTEYEFSDQTVSFRGLIFIPGDGFSTISAPNDVFNTGFIKISNLKMDNCRISMVDLNIETLGTAHVFGVDIDSVIFDMQNFTPNNFDSLLKNRAIEITERDDTAEHKGNVAVRNCKFIEGFLEIGEESRLRNLRFLNNTLYSDSTGYLISDDIVTFSNAADGSNIEIFGNYISDNHFAIENASAPLLTSTEKMSARLESNIYVGGHIEANDHISADEYLLNASQSASRYVHIDQLDHPTLGGAVASGMALGTFNNGTRTVKVLLSAPNTIDICWIRLPEIEAGQTLTSVTVNFYVQAPSNEFIPYNYTIYSEDIDLDRTSEVSGSMAASIHPNGILGYSRVLNLSVAGAANKFFYIELKRSAVGTGLYQYITHITYTVDINDVGGIGGF